MGYYVLRKISTGLNKLQDLRYNMVINVKGLYNGIKSRNNG